MMIKILNTFGSIFVLISFGLIVANIFSTNTSGLFMAVCLFGALNGFIAIAVAEILDETRKGK